jgi:hypothetical protein
VSEKTALVPLEERSVDFYGDTLVAALVRIDDQPVVYVPVRPLCDYLGLSWSGQYERMRRDPVLAEALRSVRVTRTETGERELICLPLEYLQRSPVEPKSLRLAISGEAKRLWSGRKTGVVPADRGEARIPGALALGVSKAHSPGPVRGGAHLPGRLAQGSRVSRSVMYPRLKPVGLRPVAPAWCFQKPCSQAHSSTTDRWGA